MSDALNRLRTFLLAAWLGAAIFFSVAVAPSAFGVLRAAAVSDAGEIAGDIVNRTLAIVNTSGFFISLLCIVIAAIIRRRYSRQTLIVQLMFFGLMALTTGVGQWLIAAKMHALRLAIGVPIDEVSINSPNRVAFTTLHGYSVAALSIAIIAGLIVFVIMGMRAEMERD